MKQKIQDMMHIIEGKASSHQDSCFRELVSFFSVYNNKVISVFTGLIEKR